MPWCFIFCMIDVYLVGHGFMHETQTVTLDVPIVTYVKDDKLYDGPQTKVLLDGKFKAPSSDYAVKEWKAKEKIHEHYFCSDMATVGDMKGAKNWDTAKKTPKALGKIGKLYTYTDKQQYVFVSEYTQVVRLSDLVKKLSDELGGADKYKLHWTACRSFVTGKSDADLLKSSDDGGMNNDNVKVTKFVVL
jgi:hypothetical protein